MIFFLLFAFVCLTGTPCTAMDMPKVTQAEETPLHRVKNELKEKTQAYKDYAEDQITYWNSLKAAFDPNIPDNVEYYADRVNLLNAHDKKMCQERLLALAKDKETRSASVNIKRRASMGVMVDYFDGKINLLNRSHELYDLTLSALDSENINDVFLAQLSGYGFYIKSRFTMLMTDKAPIFSAFSEKYDEYNRHKMEAEITKFDMMIDLIVSIYPFVDHSNAKIQKLLSYLPVLSTFIKNPERVIDMDAFCLDGISIIGYGGQQSEQPKDEPFQERTRLPLIDLDFLRPLYDPSFEKERIVWDKVYDDLIKKHAPQSKNIMENKTQKIQMAREQTKKEKTYPSLIAPTNTASSAKRPVRPTRRQTQQTESSVNKVPITLQEKPSALDETLSSATSIGVIVPPTQSQIDTTSTTQKQPLELSRSSLPLQSSVEGAPKKTRAQKKIDKKQRAMEKHQAQARNPLVSDIPLPPPPPPSLQSTHHVMLSDTDIINVGGHYTLLYNLLTHQLTPTTRYEDIISALESLGIMIETRGNGDYRKLILPNGRKIFIFRPAVPQVGKLFLKKLRDELPLKWGLTVKNLAHL